ncbi:MAG: putative cobaltochelatase [Candidatus Hydrogenedentota bacterium]
MSCRKTVFPFTAIVGQEKMKKSLILNAINPHLGGVLIRGQKGTAKSTAARALAALLPEIEVVADCPFHCSPVKLDQMCHNCTERKRTSEQLPVLKRKMQVVDLPLGATEDRIIGTLDIESAIKTGEKKFEPGILAQVNRGILYVDEINLLDDHLVDILLDSAAMGVNIIEREGVSYSHPAKFILVGTMNPEEGELRPQLLDRFGLCVEVEGIQDIEMRMQIVSRTLEYEKDPHSFERKWAEEEKKLQEIIIKGINIFPEVEYSDETVKLIASICVDMGVDGHRADISMLKVASTIAAYHGRTNVTEQDVKEAAELVMYHRMRRKPFQEPQINLDKIDKSIEKHKHEHNNTNHNKNNNHSHNSQQNKPEHNPNNNTETNFPSGDTFKVKSFTFVKDKEPKTGTGRRSTTTSNTRQGRYTRSRNANGKVEDIAIDATIRAAAPHQISRQSIVHSPQQDRGPSTVNSGLIIKQQDIQNKVRARKIGSTIVFILDSSGSMGVNQRMIETKGAILSLLIDSYQKRDRVGLVAFKGDSAEVVLNPTSSVEMAKKTLESLPTGGKTPLSKGLMQGFKVIQNELNRDKNIKPVLVLISDGKANVSMSQNIDAFSESIRVAEQIKSSGIKSIVIDTENGFLRFEKLKQLSEVMCAAYYRLENLKAENIAGIVREVL